MTTQTFIVKNPTGNPMAMKVSGGITPVYVLPGLVNEVTISTGQTYSVELVATSVVPNGAGGHGEE